MQFCGHNRLMYYRHGGMHYNLIFFADSPGMHGQQKITQIVHFAGTMNMTDDPKHGHLEYMVLEPDNSMAVIV